MFDFLRSTKHFRWLAYVIEWAAPLIVTTALVVALFTTFQRSSDLQQEGRHAQEKACAAVKQNNDALIAFLQDRVNHSATRPSGQQGLDDLATAFKGVEKQCALAAKP